MPVYAIKNYARILVFNVLLFASLAGAIAKADERFIQIQRQPLSSALTQFAKQTGLQLLFESSLVADKISQEIKGTYDPSVALELMLGNSGLGYKFANETTITIHQLQTTASIKDEYAEGYLIEEIEVTAQKRSQSLQDVSIAISVFGEKSLRRLGILSTTDFSPYTSNLDVKNSTGNGNPIFTLRGLGISTFASNANPSVGMYIDEIYLSSNNMMSFSIFDLERVEVLKGPQGTVFGRNTTGGAVSFVTKRPNTEATEGELGITLGNYETTNVDGAINLPLSETLAARFAFTSQQQDRGFFHNRLNGEDISGIDRQYSRLSLLWEPTERLTLNANIHAGRDKSNNGPWQGVGSRDPDAGIPDADWPAGIKFITDCAAHNNDNVKGAITNCVDISGYRDSDANDPFEGEFSGAFSNDVRSSGGVLNIDWDITEKLNLTSVTGYENLKRNVTEDFDGGPNRVADNTFDNETSSFQQELRLAASNHLADWMLGIFYSKDTNETTDLYGYSARFLADLLVDFDQETETAAAYINTQWHVSDKLKLDAGIRFTTEETHWDGSTSTLNLIAAQAEVLGIDVDGPGILLGAQRDETIAANEFTYKFGAGYFLEKDVMLYANVSRGFKSGGFNGTWASSFEETRPYDSEQVIAWEAGFKSTLFRGLMQLNGSVFNYDYTDMQVFGIDAQGRFGISNAGDADILGFELDLWYRPAKGLDIKVDIGYLDSEFVEFRSSTDDFTGNTLPNASNRSFNGLIRYEMPVFSGMLLAPMLDASYKGKTYFTPKNTQIESQDSYTLFNARLSLSSVEDSWEVALWIKNIEDKLYYNESIHSGSAGVTGRLPGMPRTYGLDFIYRIN